MNVIIATNHVLRLVILKNTCEHILMRNLTNGDHCDYASATASHLRRHEKTHKNPKGQNSRIKVCNNNRNNQPQQLQLVYSVTSAHIFTLLQIC